MKKPTHVKKLERMHKRICSKCGKDIPEGVGAYNITPEGHKGEYIWDCVECHSAH